MLNVLKVLLQVQEIDMKMIRLMRLKKERQQELNHIQALRNDLHKQLQAKEEEIFNLKKEVKVAETEIAEISARSSKLEEQQNAVKKVEEFNALSQEIASAERQRVHKEQHLNDLMESLADEEEVLKALQGNIQSSENSSHAYEEEVLESIHNINMEGQGLKSERDQLKENVDPEVLKIYERLLVNKQDRVVVPIENRACNGCHIILTAQHENLVRKGEKLIYCEHCSRIHYWQESQALEDSVVATKKRRRRKTAK
ncbi:MAG: zinc ribbon domain regulatory protein CdsZ [Chlamydiota bacterium]